jgi:hypothetical protein
MEVRPDLQVRAEIILQPEDGRWVSTPEELNNVADGLNSILQSSNPRAGWPFRLTLREYIGLLLRRVRCLPEAFPEIITAKMMDDVHIDFERPRRGSKLEREALGELLLLSAPERQWPCLPCYGCRLRLADAFRRRSQPHAT